MYHTVHKMTGQMNPQPKFSSKLFNTREECKRYEWNFYKPSRVIMWTFIERFIGKLDEWLE